MNPGNPQTKKLKSKKDEAVIISPEIKSDDPIESTEKVGDGKVVMENDKPHFVLGKKENNGSSAPENLPLAGEPTDEEVKERLNRLMRGEL